MGADGLRHVILPLLSWPSNFCSQGLSVRKESLNRFLRAHLGLCLDPKPQGLITDLLPTVWCLRSMTVSEGWGLEGRDREDLGILKRGVLGDLGTPGPRDRRSLPAVMKRLFAVGSAGKLEPGAMSSPQQVGRQLPREKR